MISKSRKYKSADYTEQDYITLDVYNRYSNMQPKPEIKLTAGREWVSPIVEEETLKRAKKRVTKKRSKKTITVSLTFLIILGFIILNSAKNFSEDLIFRRIANANINFSADSNFVHKAENLISNDSFLGSRFIGEVNFDKPIMKSPVYNLEMTKLKNHLENLTKNYTGLTAGIFVFDYSTGNYVNLNADKEFSTASMIKLPILCELFRRIDLGLVNPGENMKMTEYYRTGGSGHLQLRAANSEFSILELAKYMIQTSDNTATNMLLSSVGGVEELNRALRLWGFSKTSMATWLPDLNGTNVSTPRDLSTILYNIDNPDFLSLQSRAQIIEIMSNVKNRSLIRAGLPDDAQFIHKTGDIGTMLGDAGVVTMPNGKRYIVAMMIKRPWNSYQAKLLINEASKIIYNSFATNDLL